MVLIIGGTAGSTGGGTFPGNPNYGGFRPVGNHTQMAHAGTFADGTNHAGTYIVRHQIAASSKQLRFVYSNTIQNEGDGPNAITIKVSLRRMADATTIPLTFYGQRTITLAPGADAVTDPVTCSVAAGDYIQSITYVTVASAGQVWPVQTNISRVFGSEGYATGVDKTDGNTSGYDYSTAQNAFVPTLILGDANSNLPIIGVEGDSIAAGAGDPMLYGMWERAFAGTYCFALLSQGGVGAGSVQLRWQSNHRLKWLAGATHIVCAYGPNDAAGGGTAAQIAGVLLTVWGFRQALGAKVYHATMPPNTTSTDSWATTTNQTVKSFEAVRVALNDWVRGGAHVDGSGVPVFDGSGTPSPLLTGYVETADALETSRNSGKWKVTGGAWTADGIHPNTLAHTNAAPTIAAWAATLS